MIEIALISLLDVGSYTYLDPDKVYAGKVPQNATPPYVHMDRVNFLPSESKGNTSHVDLYIISFTIISNSVLLCNNISDEIRADIDGVRNTSVAGVEIESIRMVNSISAFNDELDLHALIVDYECKVKNI